MSASLRPKCPTPMQIYFFIYVYYCCGVVCIRLRSIVTHRPMTTRRPPAFCRPPTATRLQRRTNPLLGPLSWPFADVISILMKVDQNTFPMHSQRYAVIISIALDSYFWTVHKISNTSMFFFLQNTMMINPLYCNYLIFKMNDGKSPLQIMPYILLVIHWVSLIEYYYSYRWMLRVVICLFLYAFDHCHLMLQIRNKDRQQQCHVWQVADKSY